MDTKSDNELLLPPLRSDRHYSRPESEDSNIITIVRSPFETKEQFFNRMENALDYVCFSLAGEILESQDKGWWCIDDNE